jgi:hypothetical protein
VWVRNNGLLSDGELDHDSDSSYDDWMSKKTRKKMGYPKKKKKNNPMLNSYVFFIPL